MEPLVACQRSASAALEAVSVAFSALGSAVLCLDRSFAIVHASPLLGLLLGEEAANRAIGRGVEELIAPDLLGEGGALRSALENGEHREGSHAALRVADGSTRCFALTVAAVPPAGGEVLGAGIRYLVILREHVTVVADEKPRLEGRASSDDPHVGAEDSEQSRIRTALETHRWRREEAAHALGISRTTLWRKMREHGML